MAQTKDWDDAPGSFEELVAALAEAAPVRSSGEK